MTVEWSTVREVCSRWCTVCAGVVGGLGAGRWRCEVCGKHSGRAVGPGLESGVGQSVYVSHRSA